MDMADIDPIAAWKEWKQGREDMTLEDGEVVDAHTAAAFMVLSEVVTQLPLTTRLQEVS